MFPLSYMADAEAARGLNETYEFRVGDEVFHLKVGDGRVVPRVGAAQDPDLVVTMPTETLVDMLAQSLSPVDAVAQGKVDVEGEPAVLGHALALWPPDAPQ